MLSNPYSREGAGGHSNDEAVKKRPLPREGEDMTENRRIGTRRIERSRLQEGFDDPRKVIRQILAVLLNSFVRQHSRTVAATTPTFSRISTAYA